MAGLDLTDTGAPLTNGTASGSGPWRRQRRRRWSWRQRRHARSRHGMGRAPAPRSPTAPPHRSPSRTARALPRRRGRLLGERLVDLQRRAVAIGVEVAGPKAALAARYVAALRAPPLLPPAPPHAPAQQLPSLVSIDVGLRNLAFAHVRGDGTVLDWQRVAVFEDGRGGHHAAVSATAARALVARLPAADVYMVEEQRHRTQGSKAMAETVFRLGVLEGQLHALLPGAQSVSPARVASLFGLPVGRDKKNAAVAVVAALLAGSGGADLAAAARSPESDLGRSDPARSDPARSDPARSDGAEAPATLPPPRRRHVQPRKPAWPVPDLSSLPVRLAWAPGVADAFVAQRKQDDLCDCLLQALAVLCWQAHRRRDRAAMALDACGCPACVQARTAKQSES